MVQGWRRLTPIWAQRWVRGWLGLGRGDLVGAGGTGAVADSGVVGAKGRYWALASLPVILSGFGLRDMAGPRVLGGGILAGSVAALRGEMK